MKIFITGASGFIGSHVVEAFLKEGHVVRALVHYNAKGSRGYLYDLPTEWQENLEVKFGDITDSFSMLEIIKGCDIVLHLAALIGIPYSYIAPQSYISTNVYGTLNILEACRNAKISRLIITSTSEVYGSAIYSPINEEHPLQGQSPYSASKIAADKLAESYFCSFDLPVVTLRPFNTYGPRQSKRAIIPTILTQALNGADEIELGNLNPQRDLTYVEDTARAFFLAAMAKDIEGETIHFGQGSAISIGDLATRCLDLVGSKAKLVPVSTRQRPEKSEVNLLLCNPAKAKRLLGWEPKITLDQGLLRTVEYVRANDSFNSAEEYVI